MAKSVTIMSHGRLTAFAGASGQDFSPSFQGDPMHIRSAFLFDLDGTLVDSVYQHVLAWMEALDAEGVDLSVWRIHRKIGMSGGLFVDQFLRETGLAITPE